MIITTLPHNDEDQEHLTDEMQHAIRCYVHDYKALTNVQESPYGYAEGAVFS